MATLSSVACGTDGRVPAADSDVSGASADTNADTNADTLESSEDTRQDSVDPTPMIDTFPSDTRPPPDDHCHTDCLDGSHTCTNGVVTAFAAGSAPCDAGPNPCEYTFSCPQSTVCAIPLAHHTTMDAEAMCVHASAVGDACTVDRDCHEPPSVISDGVATVTYFGCDNGSCQPEAAPIVDDYMVGCASANELEVPFGRIAPSSTCSGGVCLIVSDSENQCMRHGCTQYCASDQECPQGSVCRMRNQATGSPVAGGLDGTICSPGGTPLSPIGPQCGPSID